MVYCHLGLAGERRGMWMERAETRKRREDLKKKALRRHRGVTAL
jgi:hypothetical protein